MLLIGLKPDPDVRSGLNVGVARRGVRVRQDCEKSAKRVQVEAAGPVSGAGGRFRGQLSN